MKIETVIPDDSKTIKNVHLIKIEDKIYMEYRIDNNETRFTFIAKDSDYRALKNSDINLFELLKEIKYIISREYLFISKPNIIIKDSDKNSYFEYQLNYGS